MQFNASKTYKLYFANYYDNFSMEKLSGLGFI